jgi:hypothetical protein
MAIRRWAALLAEPSKASGSELRVGVSAHGFESTPFVELIGKTGGKNKSRGMKDMRNIFGRGG